MNASVGPNIVRPAGTPNVGPLATNTMEMSIAKQKADKDKKEAAAIKLAIRKQKCVEAHAALVQLLVPPTTHRGSLRVMQEQELQELTPSELVAQAALLMTSEDPQGMIACSGIAIDQAILALGAVAPQPQARLIAAILRNKNDELQAIDAVNAYMGRTDQPGDDGGDDGNDEDHDSLPCSYYDYEDGSEDDSEDDEDITFIDTSSSSRLPAALSTVGVETAVGTEVVRDLGKRKSIATKMFGQFHGKVQQPVLGNISNPAFKQPKSKKQRKSVREESQQMQFPSDQHSGAKATTVVPPNGASQAPVPLKAHDGATGVLTEDASPSSDAEDVSSTNSSDNDDNDVTRLLFGDINFDGMQDEDGPVTTTTGGSAGSVIVQERPLKDKLTQQPELGSVDGHNSDLVLQCFTVAPEFQLHRYREPGTVLAAGEGPLLLQQVISPTATVPLVPQANDSAVLSERYRSSSFGQQVTTLHKTWNALHGCTSLQRMRGWLEGMQPYSHIYCFCCYPYKI